MAKIIKHVESLSWNYVELLIHVAIPMKGAKGLYFAWSGHTRKTLSSLRVKKMGSISEMSIDEWPRTGKREKNRKKWSMNMRHKTNTGPRSNLEHIATRRGNWLPDSDGMAMLNDLLIHLCHFSYVLSNSATSNEPFITLMFGSYY